MRLKNFRGFEDTGWLDFRPITVVFGKNSSGKSTLLRGPLLLRQLMSPQTSTDGVTLSGADVDMGSFRDMVYRGEVRRDVRLSFEFIWPRMRPSSRKVFVERGVDTMAESVVLDVDLRWNARASMTQFQRIAFRESRASRNHAIELVRQSPTKTRVEIPSAGIRSSISDSPELSLQSLPFIGSSLGRGRDLTDPALLLFAVHSRLTDITQRLAHIGPLRSMPERAYRLDSLRPGGPSGHMVVIMARNQQAVEAASVAFQALELASSIEVVRPAPGYLGIVLVDKTTRRRTNLADVGFGASQVLPIIVTMASVAPGTLVLIQQPELHLHPDTQGKITDVLYDLAWQRGLTLMIESHSEHLLLRSQTRLAKGDIRPSDFELIVVDAGRIKRAGVTPNGQLDTSKLPRDFFEEEWDEAVRLARASRPLSVS